MWRVAFRLKNNDGTLLLIQADAGFLEERQHIPNLQRRAWLLTRMQGPIGHRMDHDDLHVVPDKKLCILSIIDAFS